MDRMIRTAVAAWAVVLGVSAVGCAHAPEATREVTPTVGDPKTERATVAGKVIGFADQQDTFAWLGIPFAEPPVGPRRWTAPVPAAPWEGVRPALKFGSSCAQLDNLSIEGPDRRGEKTAGSEDCLTLNVWTPRFAPEAVPTGAKRLPVMVWIHGGGNAIGGTVAYPWARNLAGAEQVVVVSMNYRLGVFGWLYHPALQGRDGSPEDRSGNYGTLDQLRALEWVRDNVSAFGGDPGNVTIFGESAGGMNVFALLVSPKARGLFHRAIAQSGLPTSSSLAQAANYTDDPEKGGENSSGELVLRMLQADKRAANRAEAKAVAARLGAGEIAQLFRSRPTAALLGLYDGGAIGMYRLPHLLRDGAVLPAEPAYTLLTDPARYNAVPTIVGTNRDELKLFLSMDPNYVGKALGFIPYVRDLAVYDRDSAFMSDAWKLIGADLPAARMRAAQGPTVWAYRFDWDEEGKKGPVDVGVLIGAGHAMEIPFVFGAPEVQYFGVVTEENLPGRRELSAAMRSYWAEFARTGNPGRGGKASQPEWTPWDEGAPDAPRFIVFDTQTGGGIRMSSQTVTLQALADRLMKDPSFANKPEERCKVFHSVTNFVQMGGLAAQDRLDALLKDSGCAAVPAVAR